MDSEKLGFVIIGLGISCALLVLIFRRARREGAAQNWPSAQATIQTAQIEEIGTGRYKVELPCFAFSYVVDGEYFSGRFALEAKGDRAEQLIREMVDRKLTVHYEPNHPSSFFIPDEFIEGCDVRLVPD